MVRYIYYSTYLKDWACLATMQLILLIEIGKMDIFPMIVVGIVLEAFVLPTLNDIVQ